MHVGLLTAGDIHTPSGGHLYNKRLCQWLEAHGDRVSIYTIPHRSYGAHLTDNVRPRFRQKLAAIADSVDILLEDSLVYPSVLQLNAKLAAPTVALLHLLPSTVYQVGDSMSESLLTTLHAQAERLYLNSVDGIIHNSDLTKQTVNNMISPSKELVAPPAGDRFDPNTGHSQRTRDVTDTLRVLVVGSVCHRKGHDTLIESLRLIPDTVDLAVTVVGQTTAEPEFARQIQHAADRLAIPVTVTGAISDDLLAKHFADADVLALPSRYESFGMVYLEAMSFGVVPIGTTAGAASSVIGDSGIVIPPNDPDALSSALEAFALDRSMLRSYSFRARKRYGEHPDWETTASSIQEFLTSIVAG